MRCSSFGQGRAAPRRLGMCVEATGAHRSVVGMASRRPAAPRRPAGHRRRPGDAEAFFDEFVERTRRALFSSSALYAASLRHKVWRGIFESMVDMSDHGDLMAKFLSLPCRLFMYGEQNSSLPIEGTDSRPVGRRVARRYRFHLDASSAST